jgi:prolycopene isomerase
LATAALLAHRGRSVLVAERSAGAGGYAKPFRRGPYLFDPAIHAFPEVEYVKNFFAYLGVSDMVDLVRADVPFHAVYPEFSISFPYGVDQPADVLAEQFPHEAASVRSFFALRDQIFHEAASVPQTLGLDKLDAAAKAFPNLFKYRSATLAAVLDEELSDPRLKAVIGSLWPYQGSPPERVGFILYSQYLRAFMQGAYYAMGSFGTCVDALVTALERDGGELIVTSPVAKILVEDGCARGVRLEDGTELRAELVVSNADATATWERLVGPEHLPRAYAKKLQRLKLSFSACVLYTATTLPLEELGAAHETFVYKHWDHADTYRDVLDHRPGGMWVSVPSLLDQSLAPPGESIVILSSLAAHDEHWPGREEQFRELMLDELEALFPGFRDQLKFAELATPPTFERYSGNREGAIYGWEQTARQSGSGRLAHTTPIQGLLLTGHWTQEGSSFLRQLVGGDATVQHVLREAGEEPLPSFRPDYMPGVSDFTPE